MTIPDIAAIVLAAGTSCRFGKDNKLLAPFNGKPMIMRTIENIEKAGIKNILVVTGFEDERVQDTLKEKNIRFISNPNYKDGIAASIRVGIGALPDNCDAAFIALGDMPRVSPNTIAALAAAHGKIIIPVHHSKRGNPVLWHRDMFEVLSSVEGDTGGKQVISRHPDAVTEIPVNDPGILFDLDTKEALDRA